MNAVFLDPLAEERRLLVTQLGRVQRRCSDLVARQAAEIARLEACVMQLRGALIVRDTALAFAREERRQLEAAVPGLSRRAVLARRVEDLMMRVQDLMRERLVSRPAPMPELRRRAVLCVGGDAAALDVARRSVERAGGEFVLNRLEAEEDEQALEASIRAADLVICQTGCVSHDLYWRVQDCCRRTGKRCVMAGALTPVVEALVESEA